MPSRTHTPERRQKIDRRHEDLGPPPGHEERRRSPERRHPRVEHVDFDEHIDVPPVRESARPRES